MARSGTEPSGKTVTTNRARQGPLGRQVLMVLIGGLVLAMAAWGVAEIYGWTIAPAEVDTQTTAPPG